jgi:hypothetical protein
VIVARKSSWLQIQLVLQLHRPKQFFAAANAAKIGFDIFQHYYFIELSDVQLLVRSRLCFVLFASATSRLYQLAYHSKVNNCNNKIVDAVNQQVKLFLKKR